MTVDLDHDELYFLVIHESPRGETLKVPIIEKNGEWVAGNLGAWLWDSEALKNLSEVQLYSIYQICKDARKKKK